MTSDGVMAAAFPGSSTFTWEPVAMNLSSAIIVDGLTDAAARPETRDLPYLSLNPPGLFGCPNTGLPATISFRNLSDFFGFASSSPADTGDASFLPRKSHSLSPSFAVCLSTFFDFWISPSQSTRHIPPLILLVRTRSIFLCPETSSSSLPSPSMHTGEFRITCLTSYGEGRYCRCFTLLYA